MFLLAYLWITNISTVSVPDVVILQDGDILWSVWMVVDGGRLHPNIGTHCWTGFYLLLFNFQGKFSQVFDLQDSDIDNDDSYHREG